MRHCAAFKKISHVIFDMDGVLLDTEIIYQNVIANIAKRFEKTYTAEIQGKLLGTVERDSCRIAVTEMQLPMSVDEFQIEFRTKSHEQFHNVPLLPGAETIVRHLHKNNIPLAVATSSSQDSFELKAKSHKDFFAVFNHIVCGGTDPEVKRGKPEPDIFLICASRFADKPPPDKCLVFEDSPNGVKAAIAAGMQVVMIPNENVPEKLRKDTPFVLKTILDTPLEKFGLPPLTTT